MRPFSSHRFKSRTPAVGRITCRMCVIAQYRAPQLQLTHDRFCHQRPRVRAIAEATSRCRDVCRSGGPASQIAMVGLDRRHDRSGRPSASNGAIPMPRTQPSCRGRADNCIARMMRKSTTRGHRRTPRYCFCRASDCWFATHSTVVPRAGGRLHGRDDAQVEPPEVDVGRRAIASVGHLTTGSPRSQSRGRGQPHDRVSPDPRAARRRVSWCTPAALHR